jgi:hypothetical protein
MSFNVDRSPPAVLALIDKIESDERLRNILAAAADSNAKLLDALKNKLNEPEQDQAKQILPRQRRKNMNGWDAGAILEVEQNARQKKLVKAIVEQVQTYQDIRADVLKHTATAAATGGSDSMNRIYVGSLDFSITETYVEQLFGAFGRVLNVSMPRVRPCRVDRVAVFYSAVSTLTPIILLCYLFISYLSHFPPLSLSLTSLSLS